VLAHSDIKDFSEKIVEALNTTPKVMDARSYVVKNYDWEIVKKRINEVLSEII
jgi:glycosyltransferase involved in cell wall biosynthesis